jgi:hypothetical protein
MDLSGDFVDLIVADTGSYFELVRVLCLFCVCFVCVLCVLITVQFSCLCL